MANLREGDFYRLTWSGLRPGGTQEYSSRAQPESSSLWPAIWRVGPEAVAADPLVAWGVAGLPVSCCCWWGCWPGALQLSELTCAFLLSMELLRAAVAEDEAPESVGVGTMTDVLLFTTMVDMSYWRFRGLGGTCLEREMVWLKNVERDWSLSEMNVACDAKSLSKITSQQSNGRSNYPENPLLAQ